MKKITLFILTAISFVMANAAVTSVDDIVGWYTDNWDYRSYYATKITGTTGTSQVTITKVDDKTVKINNLGNCSFDITGTFDAATQTIALDSVTVINKYYTIGKNRASEASRAIDSTGYIGTYYPRQAKITINEDGTLDADWVAMYYYAPYTYYYYYYGATDHMTKRTDLGVNWSVKGTISYYDDTNLDSVYVYLTKEATLSNMKGFDYAYQIEGYTQDGYSGMPSFIAFNVNADTIALANGYYGGTAGAWFYYVYDNNYDIWFETSDGLSTFKGNQDEGELTLYHYAYGYDASTKTYPTQHTGDVKFTWKKSSAIKGDVNEDGVVNSSDISALVQMILNGQSSTAGDVNGDGVVNASDISALTTIILG